MKREFTIIIPTFNRSEMLDHAIRQCLRQTHPDYEILVVDNASTDGTQKMMRHWSNHPKIRYHRHQHNLGILENHRTALYSLCNSEYALILSDDDYLIDDNFLSEAAAIFKSEVSISAVAGGIIYHSPPSSDRVILPSTQGKLSSDDYFLSFQNVNIRPSGISATSFRVESILPYQVFQQKIPCFDFYFMDSLALAGNWHLLQKPVLYYRKHTNNFSGQVKNHNSWYSYIVKQCQLFQIPIQIKAHSRGTGITAKAMKHYHSTYILNIYNDMLHRIMLLTNWKYSALYLAYRYCRKHYELRLPHPIFSYSYLWLERLKTKLFLRQRGTL